MQSNLTNEQPRTLTDYNYITTCENAITYPTKIYTDHNMISGGIEKKEQERKICRSFTEISIINSD